MSKGQLIAEIRRHNASALPHFLARFNESALEKYLQQLEGAEKRHVRIAGWVRKQKQRA